MLNRIGNVAIGAVVAAALALSTAPARAQTITGAVRAAGGPVVGATVWLLELDRLERSGAQGDFRFANVPAGTYRIFVAATGFASVTDTVQVTATTAAASFDLRPSAVPLRAIVVSASPTARPADELYQPAESKSRVEFDNSPGTSFAEKLSDLPGVTIRGNGSAPNRRRHRSSPRMTISSPPVGCFEMTSRLGSSQITGQPA